MPKIAKNAQKCTILTTNPLFGFLGGGGGRKAQIFIYAPPRPPPIFENPDSVTRRFEFSHNRQSEILNIKVSQKGVGDFVKKGYLKGDSIKKGGLGSFTHSA